MTDIRALSRDMDRALAAGDALMTEALNKLREAEIGLADSETQIDTLLDKIDVQRDQIIALQEEVAEWKSLALP